MRTFTRTVGEGRSRLDINYTVMDREELIPEEQARAARALRGMLGESQASHDSES